MKQEGFSMKRLVAMILALCLLAACCLTAALADSSALADYYMELNGVERESSPGKYYLTLDLPHDAPIEFVSPEEAIKVQNGFIYFSANWCPHCRNFIGILLDVAKELNMDNLYYSSAEDIKTQWELDENNKPVITKEAGEHYYELLDWLAPVIADYTLTDSEGNAVPTGEKRIYMPSLIKVVDGVPVMRWGLGNARSEGYIPNADAHAPWTEEQKTSVRNSIIALFTE